MPNEIWQRPEKIQFLEWSLLFVPQSGHLQCESLPTTEGSSGNQTKDSLFSACKAGILTTTTKFTSISYWMFILSVQLFCKQVSVTVVSYREDVIIVARRACRYFDVTAVKKNSQVQILISCLSRLYSHWAAWSSVTVQRWGADMQAWSTRC